jgi:CubicO group peptidase (beta-lactamase class C family)
MKKVALLALVVFAAFQSNAQKKPAADNRLAGIDAKLQALLTDWKVAGFAVAVVEKNKIVYAKGFGYSNYDKKTPVTPNTLFAIGSCTKAFTSSVLGLLRNDSKVDFTKSPSLYVPELKFYNEEMNNGITVRDLMSHVTGLPRHDYSWYLFNTDARDSLMYRIQYQEPSAKVRARWQYNNFMFMTQGIIAERLTGMSWEKNVSEKLFKPLNMTRSTLSIKDMEKVTDVSLGYGVKDDKEIIKKDYYHIRGMAPAGSINSSVNEMANWVNMWIHGGKFNGKELLPTSYVTEAAISQSVIRGALPSKEHPDVQFANYGYGWFLASYKGHYRVEHGGNIDGFSASTCFFPSDSVGIIVLVNQDGSSVPSIVRNMIADRMLNVSQSDWNKELKDAADKNKKEAADSKSKESSSKKKGTKPSHLLEDLEGNYSHPGYGTIKLFVKKDSLFAKTPHVTFWLKHFHYDIFQPFLIEKHRIDTAENSEVRFNFRTGLMGDVESVSIHEMEGALDKPLEFSRQPAMKEITAEALKQYEGEYLLSGMTTKVFIKGGKTLFLFVPGQPEYELIYLGQDKFAIKALTGYKLQFEGPNMSTLSFIQPNGTFKAVRK